MIRRRCAYALAIIAAAMIGLCASASAYVLDAGTGPFTNPPAGGYTTRVQVTGSAAAQNPLIARLIAAAVRYWEGVPSSCPAGLTINLSTDDPDAGDDKIYNGWVYDDELCAMYLNVLNEQWPITTANAFDWCPVITHEMGHMFGLGHSANKLNIMTDDWIPQANPECNAFPHRGYRDAKPSPKLRDPFYDRKGKRIPASKRVRAKTL